MMERCCSICGTLAQHKISEVLYSECRHPFTNYLCHEHFIQVMGLAAKDFFDRDGKWNRWEIDGTNSAFGVAYK